MLTLFLPSRCCGGRALETGAPAPVGPCCPTELSCSLPQLRKAWLWHPQVRTVLLQGVPCPPQAACRRLHPASTMGQGAGGLRVAQWGWGSTGEPESVGRCGAGQWGCPPSAGAPVQGCRRARSSSPSVPLQSRLKGPPRSAAAPAAEPPQPPALRPAPSAGPTQDSPPRQPPAPRLEDGEAAAVHPVGLRPSAAAPRAGACLQGLSCLSIINPAGPGPSVYASIPQHTPNCPWALAGTAPCPTTPPGSA